MNQIKLFIEITRLKKKYNLKNWVTYFSDPWSDNPFFNKSYFGFEKLILFLLKR